MLNDPAERRTIYERPAITGTLNIHPELALDQVCMLVVRSGTVEVDCSGWKYSSLTKGDR